MWARHNRRKARKKWPRKHPTISSKLIHGKERGEGGKEGERGREGERERGRGRGVGVGEREREKICVHGNIINCSSTYCNDFGYSSLKIMYPTRVQPRNYRKDSFFN